MEQDDDILDRFKLMILDPKTGKLKNDF